MDQPLQSSLIQPETHLVTCQSELEHNRVRTGRADDPAYFRCRSCRHNALGLANAYLTPQAVYQAWVEATRKDERPIVNYSARS